LANTPDKDTNSKSPAIVCVICVCCHAVDLRLRIVTFV